MSDCCVAEFYCGIGGLHSALRQALPEATVIAAFDVDRDGNRVYEQNTGLTPKRVDIGTLTVQFLESLNASMWLLSPPCQPFTRQGLKRDSDDPRAKSFLHLLETLAKMHPRHVPSYFLLENVVGFEQSETRDLMLDALRKSQLTAVQEFILSPDQFGVPYSRPRYFCLARKQPFLNQANRIFRQPPYPSQQESKVTVREFLGVLEERREFAVPEKFLDQCADVLNVVSEDATDLNCFTKSYGGRYFKGTGSVLATQHPESIPIVCCLQSLCCRREQSPEPPHQLIHLISGVSCQSSDLETLMQDLPLLETAERRTACLPVLSGLLKRMGIRYFTPREVASLHSFPPDFTFPGDLGMKRQFALLGNSLSVAVAAQLLSHLIDTQSDVTVHDEMI